jgi:hypothetical protein
VSVVEAGSKNEGVERIEQRKLRLCNPLAVVVYLHFSKILRQMNSHPLLPILDPAVQSARRFLLEKRRVVMPVAGQVSGGGNLGVKPAADHQTSV